MDLESWAGSVDLDTPAGRLLKKLAAALPKNREFSITVFGSAPIQICVDSGLTSAYVDVFSETEDLKDLVERLELGQGKAEFYCQVSSELNFRTSPRWRTRAKSVRVEGCLLHFPHAIDILIAKLNRGLDQTGQRSVGKAGPGMVGEPEDNCFAAGAEPVCGTCTAKSRCTLETDFWEHRHIWGRDLLAAVLLGDTRGSGWRPMGWRPSNI